MSYGVSTVLFGEEMGVLLNFQSVGKGEFVDVVCDASTSEHPIPPHSHHQCSSIFTHQVCML